MSIWRSRERNISFCSRITFPEKLNRKTRQWIVFMWGFNFGDVNIYLSTILVKSLGTLCTFANKWSFCPPPPPHPQYNVDVDSSKADPTIPTLLWGGGGGFSKLNNDFSLQNNALSVAILSSVLLVRIVGTQLCRGSSLCSYSLHGTETRISSGNLPKNLLTLTDLRYLKTNE